MREPTIKMIDRWISEAIIGSNTPGGVRRILARNVAEWAREQERLEIINDITRLCDAYRYGHEFATEREILDAIRARSAIRAANATK